MSMDDAKKNEENPGYKCYDWYICTKENK
jgi:hypothetical protein